MITGILKQKSQGFSASYENIIDGKVVATMNIPHDVKDTDLYYDHRYILHPSSYYQMRHRGIKVKNDGRSPYIIRTMDGSEKGLIYGLRTKGFFRGYQYTQVQFEGHTYDVFDISLGKEGSKHPIYENDTQVALIEIPNVVYDRLDAYTWYTLSEQHVDMVAMYILYLDYMRNAGHRLEVVTESVECSYGLTVNKALKAKYDPNFKLR